jgi:hypothetical protein
VVGSKMQVRIDYDIDNFTLGEILGAAQVGAWAETIYWVKNEFLLGFTDIESGLVYELNAMNFQEGLRALALNYPDHFYDILNGTADAYTGSAIIQCAAFGEVLYV